MIPAGNPVTFFASEHVLASRVRDFWHAAGFPQVEVWVETCEEKLGEAMVRYGAVRSNLVEGNPP